MKISEHLDLSELVRSESAKRNGIVNNPTASHLINLKLLAERVFEPIRNNFRCPIHVSSAYRSKELNSFVRGSSNSQHCTGEAIDLDMDDSPNGVTNKMVFDFIKDNLEFDQLIWEFGTKENPDWVHVSYESSGKQRKQILTASKLNGKTHYNQY